MNSLSHARPAAARLISATVIALMVLLVPSIPASAAVTQGTVGGTVTGPGDVPLPDILVYYFGDTAMEGAVTDASGNYSFDADPGTGFLMFFDPAGTYVSEMWDDASSFADATPVDVAAGGTKTASAQLAKAGHITGHVQDSAGDPIPDVEVDGYTTDGTDWQHAVLAGGLTDENGDYDFSGAPGTYRLEFTTPDDTHVSEYFDDATTLDAATDVTTAADAPAAGIDAVLQDAAAISGTVTLPLGADPADVDGEITVVDVATGDVAGETWLDPDTETDPHSYPWSVGGLRAGDYRVEFADDSGPSTSEAEFYDNHPESDGPGSATAIKLVTGQQRTGIDASLRAGGTIDGKLVDATGAPISGCQVIAYTPDDSRVWRFGTSSVDGTFVVSGLSSGSYRLVVYDFDDSSPCSTPEFYTKANGDLSPWDDGALPVPAAPGATVVLPAPLVYGGDLPAQTPAIASVAVPAVTGLARVGEQLTAFGGSWNPADATATLQWLRDGVPMPGATASSYLVSDADLGARISVRVTATKDGYLPAQRTSEPTSPVAEGNLTLAGLPRVLGTLRVGKVLTAVPSTASPAATSVRFRWLRDGKPIKTAAAKRAKYKVVRADRGRRLSVRITLIRPGYAPLVSLAKKAGKVR